jgi:choline dehydrogenase-like flavoprotein
MIVDGTTLSSGTEQEHDICIVGAGVAGILLATELAHTYHDICLVESGAWTPDDETQSLYDLDNVGYPIRANFQSRLRQFGGSCNIWAGRAMVYHEIDMQARPWMSDIGWPIAFDELDRYYARAARYLNLPSYDQFSLDYWTPKLSEFETTFLQSENFKPNIVMFAKSPARFGYKTQYYKRIRDAETITAYIRSNAVNLRLSDHLSHVTQLDIACLNGVHYQIKAKTIVLACGGLENTRILMASDQQIPGGIGNQHGLLGRYYMDHPRAVFGRVNLTKKINLEHALGIPVTGGKMQLGIGLSDKLQEREGLLNNYLSLEPNYSIAVVDAYHALVKLMKRLLRKGYSGKRFDFKNEEIADVPEMIYLLTPKELLPHFMYYSYYKYSRFIKKFISNLDHLSIVSYSDQEVTPESRVYLGPDKDQLGMPKLVLDWKVGDRSLQSSLRLLQLLDEHFKKYDAGYVEEDLSQLTALPYTDASHHLGTTRMSPHPTTGVVDLQGKVHGIDNLYIAGSSIFPTAGHANPTFTIAAMALRLVDHLNTLANR